MSATWDDQTRAHYKATTGASDAQIDQLEGGVLEHRAMQEQAIEDRLARERSSREAIANELANRERMEALSSATEIFESGEADPASIATALEQTAGRDVALEWTRTTWAPEEAVPPTAAEWIRQREFEAAQAAAQLEVVAENLRASQAAAAAKAADDHLNSLAAGFVERHPEVATNPTLEALAAGLALKKTEQLLKDTPGATIDPVAVLEEVFPLANAQATVSALARREAIEQKGFTRPGLEVRPENRFPTKEDIEAEREAFGGGTEARADTLYARRQADVAEMAARRPPTTEAEESAAYAEKWATKALPFGGALVVTGASSQAQRDAKALLNRGTNSRNAIDQIEGRAGKQREAMESARSVPAAPAEPHPDATPSSAWWYQ